MEQTPNGPTLPGDPITDQIMLWFCPGGDIADLRRARDACAGLATAISTQRPALRSAGEQAQAGWSGAAAENFGTDMVALDAWLDRYGSACTAVAATLDQHASIKEQQLHEAHMNMIHGAIDALLTVATGGEWLAARVLAEEGAAAAQSLLTIMAPVSAAAAERLSAAAVSAAAGAEAAAQEGATALGRATAWIGHQVPEWAQSIVSGHAISTVGRLADKVLGGARTPLAAFDPRSWGGIDLANIESGGFLTPLFTGIPKALGIDTLAGWRAVVAQQASGGVFNGGLTAYGEFVINGDPVTSSAAWRGVLWSTLSGVAGGTVGGGFQARSAAQALARGGSAVAARTGGLSSAEWVRTVATLPGDYFIARGTRPPSHPPPAPISPAGLPPPPQGRLAAPADPGTAGGVTADLPEMEQAGHRIAAVSADLAGAAQRFEADSFLGISQFGTTKADMQMGWQYTQFRDAADAGLRQGPATVGATGTDLQTCSRSLAACDQLNAASLRPPGG